MADQRENKIPVNWSLRDLDHGFTLQPQFPLLDPGVRIPGGADVAVINRFGMQDPITHFIAGKLKSFSFETEIYARHSGEKALVEDLLRKFETVSTKDNALGRIPICVFTLGNRYSETVLVQDANQQVLSTQDDGTPRHVIIEVTLVKYVPFTVQAIDVTKPVKESFYLVASEAEQSYEAIARRFYGDPLLGDRLRKRHPQAPMVPEVGQTVHVPPRSVMLKEVVRPEAYMLSLNDEAAVAAYDDILNDRNQRKVVVVL